MITLKPEAMKRIFGFTLFCLMVLSIQAQNQNVPQGYVDLGLPSGTLWKSSNESGFYSFDDAKRRFGSKLPSFDQWFELTKHCEWSWTGSGYRVRATNGNFIVFPAFGSSNCDGSAIGAGEYGDYWVSDHSDDIWYDFVFDELDNGHFDSGDNSEFFGCISVRLIWSE